MDKILRKLCWAHQRNNMFDVQKFRMLCKWRGQWARNLYLLLCNPSLLRHQYAEEKKFQDNIKRGWKYSNKDVTH